MNCWIDCKNGSKRVATQQRPRSAFLLSSSVVKAMTAVGSGTAAKPRRCFFCSGVKTASKLSSAVFSRPPGSLVKEITGSALYFQTVIAFVWGSANSVLELIFAKELPRFLPIQSCIPTFPRNLLRGWVVCGLGASHPRQADISPRTTDYIITATSNVTLYFLPRCN